MSELYDGQDLATQSRMPREHNSMLHMAEEFIPKFTGQDDCYSITKWLQEIEDNGEIFSWTEIQKLLVAKRALAGTAALWLRAEKTLNSYLQAT